MDFPSYIAPWLLREDGSIHLSIIARNIVFQSSLNLLVVLGTNRTVTVVDTHSGLILHSYNVGGTHPPHCIYLPQYDRLLMSDGNHICCRTPYNGVLLLDTMLQPPVSGADDLVTIELLFAEACQLLRSLNAIAAVDMKPLGLENAADLHGQLKAHVKQYDRQSQAEQVKLTKWRTVRLRYPVSYFKSVSAGIMANLHKLDINEPGMAIASAIYERATDLLIGGRMLEAVSAGGPTQRSLMHSEAMRRKTFTRWPHMDYQWALPNEMAQAGFYHQPTNSGDDRAMCFTCNVCLVCWEKTDEPWSEHDRHSPTCPFVRGKCTANVPLVVSHASEVATVMPRDEQAGTVTGEPLYDIMSTGTDTTIVCTADSASNVVMMWNVKRNLRFCGQFEVYDEAGDVARAFAGGGGDGGGGPTAAATGATEVASESTGGSATVGGGDSKVAQRAVNLHAICTYRSWDPASQGGSGSMKGLRLACGVTAADKQFLFVYRVGRDSVDKWCKDRESQPMQTQTQDELEEEEEEEEKELEVTEEKEENKQKALFPGYEEFDVPLTIVEVKVMPEHKLYEQAGKSYAEIDKLYAAEHAKILAANDYEECLEQEGPPFVEGWTGLPANYDGPTPLDLDDAQSDFDAANEGGPGALSEAGAPAVDPKASYNSTNEFVELQGDVYEKYMGCVELKPEILGNYDIVDMVLSYDNKFVLVVLSNQKKKLQKKPTKTKKLKPGAKGACGAAEANRRLPTIIDEAMEVDSDGDDDDDDDIDIDDEPFMPPTKPNQDKYLWEYDLDVDFEPDPEAEKPLSRERDTKCTQLLVYQICADGTVWPEPIARRILHRGFTPLQFSAIPSQQQQQREAASDEVAETLNTRHIWAVPVRATNKHDIDIDRRTGGDLVCGGFSMVTADGSLQLLSLLTLRTVAERFNKNQHFSSVVYCRNLERLVAGTKSGYLHFYTCFEMDCDSDADSTDLQAAADSNADTAAPGQRGGIRRALPPGKSGRQETFPKAAMDAAVMAMYMSVNPAKFGLGSISSDSSGSVKALCGTKDPALLANRSAMPGGAALSVEDLRRLHALTVFDELPVAYSAEVPAGWVEHVSQKPHRRHPLSKGSGHGGLIGAGLSGGIGNRVNIAAEPPAWCVKSWKLHHDTKPYTSDAPPNRSIHEDYLLDIALQKSTPLGHIDVRFTTFNPTLTPKAVQITLLRKNAAFGFRHRFGIGGQAAKKPATAVFTGNAQIDWSTACENNVLKEEYLTDNKMDIISGPHDLSHYMNFNELGGLLSLTSPRLFKTKSRHFVLHIKIINDTRMERVAHTTILPSMRYLSIDEINAKNKRKGILRYLFPSVAKSKSKSSTTSSSSSGSSTYSSATSSSSSSSATSPKVSQVGVQTGGSPMAAPPTTTSKDQGTNTTDKTSASAKFESMAGSAPTTTTMTATITPLQGYDSINDLHVSVRGVKATPVALKLPNERYQRIAMLESNTFLADLMRLASVPANAQQKHLALDILLWVLTIRMKRYRSPRMVKAAEDAAARNAAMAEAQPAARPAAAGAPAPPPAQPAAPVPVVDHGADMLKQQRSCVEVVQKHLVELLRNCILFGNRSTASKCVKALLNVTEGLHQMPSAKCAELRYEFDMALKHAILVCIASLSAATSASALRWFNVLLVGTSTQQSVPDIGTSCVKVLLRIANELTNRWSPYTAVLRSRFGLYGLPFEPDLFDSELAVGLATGNAAIMPSRSAAATGLGTSNISATGISGGSGSSHVGGYHQTHYDAAVQDLKRMCVGDDSASAYVYSMQIRRKCVSNQLRGLLEVEPLHFTCCAVSEATRMEPLDALAAAKETGFGVAWPYTTSTTGSINLASGGGGGQQSAATTTTTGGGGGVTVMSQPPSAAASASNTGNGNQYTLGNTELYLPKKIQTKQNNLLEQLMVIENTEMMFDEEDMPELQVVETSQLAGTSPKIDNLDAAIDFAMNSAAGGGGMSVGGPDGQVQYFQPTADGDVLNNVKNMLADKLFAASMMPGDKAKYKIIMKPASSLLMGKPKIGGGSTASAGAAGSSSGGAGPSGVSTTAKSAEEMLKKITKTTVKDKQKLSEEAWNAMQGDNILFTSYHDPETGQFVNGPGAGGSAAATSIITSLISTGLSPPLHGDLESANINAMMSKRISDFVNENLGGDEGSTVLPWHKLLTLPAKQMIVIDRMHSGARKFVVLDFGQPVMLTDVIIPACEDLVSLSIDMWCVDELADNTRLLHATDVAAKAVVLSDLQPPPICRYVKISTASRYGISSARCKIPVGQFFGHVLVMDQDGYADPIMKYIRGKNKNLSGQLRALSGLYEDVHCRYSLASHKLTQLLEPYVQGDHSNIAHMQSYLHELSDFNSGGGGIPSTTTTQSTSPLHATSETDRVRISLVYEECIQYQHQLNIVQNVMRRLQGTKRSVYVPPFAASTASATEPPASGQPTTSGATPLSATTVPEGSSATDIQMPTFRSASSDKLRVYSECILDVLLHYVTEYRTLAVNSMYVHFDRDTCERLFAALVVGGELHQQQSMCALLVQMCAGQEWWGAFMAASIVRLFSAQNTEIFSPDRVFHLLSYLGRKSMSATVNRTPTVIDEVLKALAVQLVPLSSAAQRGAPGEDERCGEAGPLTADHQLISWLLLFLSVCLDDSSAAANIVPGSTVGWNLPSKEAKLKTESNAASTASASAAGPSTPTASSTRWEFMSGDAELNRNRQSVVTSRSESARSLSRAVKKRMLMHGKAPFSAAALSSLLKDAGLSKSTLALEVEAHLKQQEHLQKKYNVKVISSSVDKSKLKKALKLAKSGLAASGGSGGSSAETLVGVDVSGSPSTATATARAAQEAPASATSPAGSAAGASGPDLLFEINVRSVKINNAVLVIRGLIGLLLSLDYMCNMDLFLLTCKIIARLVAACRPYVRFAQLINQPQLQQLVRLCIWKDQQQAWTVHAITSLLQDILEADKQYNAVNNVVASVNLEADVLGGISTAASGVADDDMRAGPMEEDEEEETTEEVVRNLMVANEKLVECQKLLSEQLQGGLGGGGSSSSTDPGMYSSLLNTSNLGYPSSMSASTMSQAIKSYDGPSGLPPAHVTVVPQHLPSLMECDDIELDDMFDDILAQHSKFSDFGDEPHSAGSAGLTTAAADTDGLGSAAAGQDQGQNAGSGGGAGAASGGGAGGAGGATQPARTTSGKHRSMGSRMRCAAFVYRTISSAMDYRLQHGLNTTVEVSLRRLTLMSSMNLFLTFPANPMLLPPMPRVKGKSGHRTQKRPSTMPAAWPEAVRRSWPDEHYPLTAAAANNTSTVDMLTDIFEEIFAALPITFTWLDVEQVLQLWQTLNFELIEPAVSDTFAAPVDVCSAQADAARISNAAARMQLDRSAISAQRQNANMMHLCESPRIPFGRAGVDGLLQFLCTQPVTGLRTWYLSFQCLIMACNPVVGKLSLTAGGSVEVAMQRLALYILEQPAFEQMLVCFYSTAENAAASSAKETRNAGPSICILLRELYAWIAIKPDMADLERAKRKLNDIKLRVVLQLVQPNGAIATHRGPQDAQLALVESIGGFEYGNEDVGVAMSIVESVSILLQYRNAQAEKVSCVPTSADSQMSSSGSLGSIYSTILFPGNRPALDEPINKLTVNLVKLCCRLTKAPDDQRQCRSTSPPVLSSWSTSTDSADTPMRACDDSNESLTDENKVAAASQQQQYHQLLLQQSNRELGAILGLVEPMDQGPASPASPPSIADNVLQHQTTMTRLLMALSQCRETTYAMLITSSYMDVVYKQRNAATAAASAAATAAALAAAASGSAADASATIKSWGELQRLKLLQMSDNITPPAASQMTLSDAVFELLITLGRLASQPRFIIQPLYEFLRTTCSQQHAMPRLQLSEPFLWFVLAIFDSAEAVACFVQLGGIEVLCQALVRSTHTQINRQPGLVTIVMQHLNRTGSTQSRPPIITLPSSAMSGAAQAAAANSANNCPQHGSLAGSFLAPNGAVTNSSSQLAKKYGNSIFNSVASMANWGSGIINFAPYCTISSWNATAQSPEVLIQTPVASHRRARNAAWTHLFYAHETHIDLHLQLPTAILLREVILQPHLPALVTGPSAVAIEINRDGSALPAVPISQPISTIGMSCIRLQLNRTEIASSLVLRLYRPRDSSSIGMTQIAVLGTSVFTRPVPIRSDQPTTATPPWALLSSTRPDCATEADLVNSNSHPGGPSAEDAAVHASLDWMRILSRCFAVVPDAATGAATSAAIDAQLADRVHRSAANYPGFLEACCSLLNVNASGAQHSFRHLEAVLLKLGLHNKELGLRLITQLLRRSQSQTFGHLNPAVSDLLYTLCTAPDEACAARIGAMLGWLQQFSAGGGGSEPLANPSTGFVRSLSAILWHAASTGQQGELPALVSDRQFDTAIRWSSELRDQAPLKQAIDELLCSMCNIRPELFVRLLLHIGVLEPLSSAAPDGNKPAQPSAESPAGGLTDDTKRAGNWHTLYAVPDVMRLSVTRAQLQTIAMACQSSVALYQLMEFRLPHIFTSLLQDFFRRMQQPQPQPSRPPPPAASADRNRPSTSAAAASSSSSSSAYQFASDAELAPMSGISQCADLLEFFTRCCEDGTVRDWLGSPAGSCFWTPMLHLLCNSQHQQRYHGRKQHTNLSRLEAAAVQYLSAVTAFHPRNQQRLTTILVDVLAKGRAPSPAPPPPAAAPKPKSTGPLTRQSSTQSGCSAASASTTASSGSASTSSSQRSGDPKHLSGFTRRLVLQLLLESERIVVGVQCRADPKQAPSATPLRPAMCPTPGSLHPAKRTLGAQLLNVSAHTKAAEIVQQCSLGWPDDGNISGRWQMWNGPQPDDMEATAATTAGAKKRQPAAAGGSGSGKSGQPRVFSGPDWTVDYDEEALFQFPEPKFISMMAAGVTAKDKRQKDERNIRAAEASRRAYSSQACPYLTHQVNRNESRPWLRLSMPQCSDNVYITHDTTVAQMLAHIASTSITTPAEPSASLLAAHPLATPFLQLDLTAVTRPTAASAAAAAAQQPSPKPAAIFCDSLPALQTPLQIFSARGGLALLAHYLPTSYAETPKTMLPPSVSVGAARLPPMTIVEAAQATFGADWVKVEAGLEDLYDDVDELLHESISGGTAAAAATASKQKGPPLSVPQHSLAAFALFLRLPAYSEVLLLDRLKAQCMLRLVLGVTGDGEGIHELNRIARITRADIITSEFRMRKTANMLVLNFNQRQHYTRILRNPYTIFTSSDAIHLIRTIRSHLFHSLNRHRPDEIYSLPLAATLPTLPFEVFRQLLLQSPLTTADGVQLRRLCIEMGAMHLLLNCLGIFTHHTQQFLRLPDDADATGTTAAAGAQPNEAGAEYPLGGASSSSQSAGKSDDKGHMYWAKGTGFGTGSTTKSWDVEQALQRQRNEEEHVVIFLQVLSSYINPGVYDWAFAAAGAEAAADDDGGDADAAMETSSPSPPTGDNAAGEAGAAGEASGSGDGTATAGGDQLPATFESLLRQSCLIPALCSYLRNDSVLDITRHIPLYRAILQLLRALALSGQLVGLLLPSVETSSSAAAGGASYAASSTSIAALLANMKSCVDTYASRLRVNKKSNIKGQTQKLTVTLDDGDDEGLAHLVPDIQETCNLVQTCTRVLIDARGMADSDETRAAAAAATLQRASLRTLEQRYIDVMKALQFDTAEMLIESDGGYCFAVSHYFEANVRAAGDRCLPTRVKRLAQESVTLSTSLPLSYSSTVFVRCDNDRLDIMKVLITGPAETPYANGCFVFDVYFPSDYPQSPMMINLETTGRRTIRFNPNLYNDGKVCLSVLNTWHGRPEEKWNAQTSSFLQVLVSIQSLILVPEPYFNEPGFERSRGSSDGTQCSREYNSNIYVANIRWAMCDQIRNTCPIFKDIVHTHFWLKRHDICVQVQQWIDELVAAADDERTGRGLKQNLSDLIGQYQALRAELGKLAVPAGFEDLDGPLVETTTRTKEMAAAAAVGGGASLGATRARRATLTEAFATIKQTTTQIAAAAVAATKAKSSTATTTTSAASSSTATASGSGMAAAAAAATASAAGPSSSSESLQVLTKQMQKQFQIQKKKEKLSGMAQVDLHKSTKEALKAKAALEAAAAEEFEANYNDICESLFQQMDSSVQDDPEEAE